MISKDILALMVKTGWRVPPFPRPHLRGPHLYQITPKPHSQPTTGRQTVNKEIPQVDLKGVGTPSLV